MLWIIVVLTAFCFGYLVLAMIKPEWF